ncbi:MAG: indole-3-glycerol phosphate synthase TrpC [bacterium]|nr:indole-3-glycerol phosphate synthase TrpC [bacterium]
MQKGSFRIWKEKRQMLNRIIEHKKAMIQRKKKVLPFDLLKSYVRSFPLRSVIEKASNENFIIIAETKKASPSGGIFRKRYSPAKIAYSYQKAGASAISVLTEDKFFFGSIEHLKKVKNRVNVPVLAKDFFIDEYQIYEAYISGADCILLILKILSDEECFYLFNVARRLNLEILAEIHNEKELSRFFKLFSENNGLLLGINSRNLDNLEINFDCVLHLLSLLKGVKIPVIVESGIANVEQLINFFNAGANGALIGSYFLKAESPGKTLKTLIKEMQNGLQKNFSE